MFFSPMHCQVQERQENPAYLRYRRILDLVFPRKESGRLSLFLRITSTSSPDCQVALIDRGKGAYQVVLHSLRDNRESVAVQANEIILRTGEADAARIAEKIPIVVEQVNVPAAVVQGWMKDFSQIKFSPMLISPHVLDGAHYDLWLSTHTSGAFYFSLVDSGVMDGKPHPLVRWMNRVVSETKALAQQGSM